MRHSLLNRFQATLWGLALGEALGIYHQLGQCGHRTTPALHNQPGNGQLSSWLPQNPLTKDFPKPLPPSWSQTVARSTQAIICSGGWDAKTWALTHAATSLPLKGDGAIANATQQTTTGQTTTGAELAIAALPMMLFYHDNELALHQNLSQVAEVWQASPEAKAEMLVVGYAIAQALTERLDPTSLIPNTITYLQQSFPDSSNAPSVCIAQLEQAQTWLQQKVDLQTVTRSLLKSKDEESGAIALMVYCFLGTPDDLRLSLLRATRSTAWPPIVCALTGALSGAFNGTVGIPLEWQLASKQSIGTWENASSEIDPLASQLLAVWSGVYDLTTASRKELAVAAPNVIRS